MSKFGALAAGFGTGYMAGQKMKMDQERLDMEKQDRELRRRRDTLEVGRLERDNADRVAIEDAGKAAFAGPNAGAVQNDDEGQPLPKVEDKRAPEDKMLGGIEAMQNEALKRGRIPEALKLFSDGADLRQKVREKEFQAADTQAQQTGDFSPYIPAYNKYVSDGKQIDPATYKVETGADGKKTHTFEVVQGDKRIPRTLSDEDMRKVIETGRDPQTMRKIELSNWITSQDPKVQAEVKLKLAQAGYFSGRNDASVDRAQVGADARVEAAGIGADSRENAAAIRAGGQVQAAGVRAAGRPGPGGARTGTGGAGGTAMYGGDKGAAKWQDDFEKHYIPKRDVKNPDGSAKINPKDGQPVQEVDDDVAPVVRDMARINHEVLASGGVHPQEAAGVFSQFAKAFKQGDRVKMFSELDKNGRIAIVENDDGHPVKAVGIMGQYRDARGQVRPMFFDLPEGMSRELVTQEYVNRVEKQKQYPDLESKRGRVGRVPAAAGVIPNGGNSGTPLRAPARYPGQNSIMQPE